MIRDYFRDWAERRRNPWSSLVAAAIFLFNGVVSFAGGFGKGAAGLVGGVSSTAGGLLFLTYAALGFRARRGSGG